MCLQRHGSTSAELQTAVQNKEDHCEFNEIQDDPKRFSCFWESEVYRKNRAETEFLIKIQLAVSE